MRVLSILLAVLFAFPALAGDTYIKTKTHNDAINVQGASKPATDEIMEQWIGDGQMAIMTPKQSFIVDLKKNAAYIVSPSSKSYVESTLPLDFAKILPPEMSAMIGNMKITVSVTPTKETKKVGKWACLGYDITMTTMGMPMKTRAWATKDVPLDMAKYQGLYSNFLKTGFFDDAAIKEMAKVGGLQVASETNAEMMGVKIHSTTEVLEISAKAAPPGVFAPPAGFTKKPTLSVNDLQK
jgi:hypothetical protein